MYYKMIYESPLGPMILAASDTVLVGAWFEGQKYCYGSLQGEVMRDEETPILRKAARWLDDYFAGRMPAIMTLPLAPQGSNPISIIIPCHRVLGANGRATGYAGGIDKKIALLHLEGIAVKA